MKYWPGKLRVPQVEVEGVVNVIVQTPFTFRANVIQCFTEAAAAG